MSIQLKNIKKSFKTNTVLNGVSLDVAKGETLVLFGPSGQRRFARYRGDERLSG